MSYQKITATTSYIRFYWPYTDIFDRLKIETQYRAKQLDPEVAEKIAISDGEEPNFEHNLKDAIKEVGKVVERLTYGLTDAIFTTEGLTENVGFLIIDKDYYNNNTLISIDSEVEKMLTYYCLYKWYQSCGMGDDFKVNLLNYERCSISLSKILFPLRKPKLASEVTPVSNYYPFILTESVDIEIGSTENSVIEFTTEAPSDDYFVQAIQSDGKSVPGFDNIIITRSTSGFTYKSATNYEDVTLIIYGSSSSSSTATTPTIKTVTGITLTAGVEVSVTHNFGDNTYFVQAIQSNGKAIPGFDDMITERSSNYFKTTSYTTYTGVTFLIMG